MDSPPLVVTHLTDVPFEVFTIDGAFSDAELDALAAFVERRCALTTPDRGFTNSPFANGKLRLPALAASIHARVRSALPDVFADRGGRAWLLEGAGDHVFYARMVPGDRFGIHTDTGSFHDASTGARSRFTALLYLRDDFEGGETAFYADDFAPTCTVVPKKGRMLVFDIERFHAGQPVASGVKTWVGVELVGRRKGAEHPPAKRLSS
jgi:hypothetical protein